MTERREIAGFPNYTVDDQGVVRRGERVLRGALRLGYWRVGLRANGKQTWLSVNVLVLEAYVGSRPTPEHQACHKNGVSTDNRLENLEWKPKKHNEADKKLHGTAVGVYTPPVDPRTKLRICRARGSIRGLAKRFGVHRRTVARLKRNAA